MKIKQNNPDLYNELQDIFTGKVDPILSPIKVLYVSYLCANDTVKYSEEEFTDLVPFNLQIINEMSARLIQGTKQK